jgi:hypothetical protein
MAGTPALSGCGGGGMSQSDMKRYAIQRPSDVEAPAPAAQKPAPRPAKPTATASVPNVDQSPAQEAITLPASSVPNLNSEPIAPTSAQPPMAAAASGVTAAPAPANALSDTQSPPAAPLDPDARRRRTIENLTKIGAAWQAFLQAKQFFPPQAITNKAKQPLLSWRVALLPYLGYSDLYSQFHLDEPWNSPHNRQLLRNIPSVYQSPERFDERTNYLGPVANRAIFGLGYGAQPSMIEDGLANTVILLEADDNEAVPWTAPRDFDLNLTEPAQKLGGLRDGSFYVVWADGQVGRVLATAPKLDLRAMFTYESGEAFAAAKVNQPLLPGAGNGTRDSSAIVGTPERADNGSSGQAAGSATSNNSELSALAATYRERSAESRAAGNERDAMLWYYAAAVVSPEGSWANDYQWVAGLKRPAPAIRFGIGLDYSGPRAEEISPAAATTRGRSATTASSSAAWTKITTAMGEEITAMLAAHAADTGGVIAESDTASGTQRRRPATRTNSPLEFSHGELLAPGVFFLAAAREATLRQMAEREAIDVLVHVGWREVGRNWSCRITLIDVVRNEALVEFPPIDSGQLDKARTDPLALNPLTDFRRRFAEALKEQLSFVPLPEQIEPRHVAGRMAALAASRSENPLRTLAEMRYYRARGLADDTQLLLAYQTLLGAQSGSELMLADATTRQRLLRQWLPPEVAGRIGSRGRAIVAAEDD